MDMTGDVLVFLLINATPLMARQGEKDTLSRRGDISLYMRIFFRPRTKYTGIGYFLTLNYLPEFV